LEKGWKEGGLQAFDKCLQPSNTVDVYQELF